MLVNLYGVPGSGKSTLALAITSTLKSRGGDAEYVGEYIKHLLAQREELHEPILNQLDILTNQNKLLKSYYNNCSYVVTDGALLNTNIYMEFNKDEQIDHCSSEIKSLCQSLDSWYKHQYNILVMPCSSKCLYKDSLRNHSYEQSRSLHSRYENLKDYDFIVEDYFNYGVNIDSLCDSIIIKYQQPI